MGDLMSQQSNDKHGVVERIGRTILYSGALFLFFWTLIGQYVYREAKKEQRSSPRLRGLGWGVLGVIGVFDYLANIRTEGKEPSGVVGIFIAAVCLLGDGASHLTEATQMVCVGGFLHRTVHSILAIRS